MAGRATARTKGWVTGRPRRRGPGRRRVILLALAGCLFLAVLAGVIGALTGGDPGNADRLAGDEGEIRRTITVVEQGPTVDSEQTDAQAAGGHRPTRPTQAPRVPSVPYPAPYPTQDPEQTIPATEEPLPGAEDDVTGPGTTSGATAMAALPGPVPVPPGPGDPSQRPLVPRDGPPPPGAPRVVIVIDDMGIDRRRSDAVVALPGRLTLAWLPYARDLPAQTAAARQAGHELIVHVPMEPEGEADPGPDALLTTLPAEELRRRLARGLSAFDGFVGINNHMGSRFTAHASGMDVVFGELAARGLFFLDSRTTAATVAPAMAARHRVPMATRNVFLDHQQTPAFVEAALRKVEEVARAEGLAIAIGHPHDVTTRALARWLPTLPEKGIHLIPVSAAVEAVRSGS